jgi:hypothetical protein
MDTEHLLVFGMPTMARQDNSDYLKWTVESMRQNCIKLDQIHVMHASPNIPHPVLQQMKAEFDRITPNASFHLVPASPKDFTIDYRLTRPDNERTKEAYGDSVDRKRFRIGEMYAFMHLARYLLNTTSVPYIGINQEDVMWNYPLLGLDKLLDKADVTSLYSRNRKVGKCINVYCGFLSLIFRRETLEDFLKWVQPIWKEEPIAWLFEDYVQDRNLTVRVDYINVEHIAEREEIEDFVAMEAKIGPRKS